MSHLRVLPPPPVDLEVEPADPAFVCLQVRKLLEKSGDPDPVRASFYAARLACRLIRRHGLKVVLEVR